MRVYIIKREFVCLLEGQVCEATKPNCKNCETYLDFKKSGQTIREYCEENTIKSY